MTTIATTAASNASKKSAGPRPAAMPAKAAPSKTLNIVDLKKLIVLPQIPSKNVKSQLVTEFASLP